MKHALLSELSNALSGKDVVDALTPFPTPGGRKEDVEVLSPPKRRTSVPRITSVYFGGGTPSLAPVDVIESILDFLSRNCEVANDVEVTVEGNPGTFPRDHLRALRGTGVNRISLGIQTFHDPTLQFLNRNHSTLDTMRTVSDIWDTFDMVEDPYLFATSGTSRRSPVLSVDIITNLPRPPIQPGDTPPTLADELSRAASLKPHHMSVYELTLERGTKLWEQVRRGEVEVETGDGVRGDTWESVRKVLEPHGYHRYEVSSFAKRSASSARRGSLYRSAHNSWTWRGGDYVGVGPGAHGRVTLPTTDGTMARFRTYRTLDPAGWLRDVAGMGHGTRRSTRLSPTTAIHELIVLGLRTTNGVFSGDIVAFVPGSTARGMSALGKHLDMEAVHRFVAGGLLVWEEGKDSARLSIGIVSLNLVGKTLHNVSGWGFDMYVTPENPAKAKGAIIGIYDVFGAHPNPRQVADNLSRATGLTVVLPDVFRGNPWDLNDMPPKAGFEALIKHITTHAPYESVSKDIKNTIQWLKANLGVEKVGLAGFCWGAKQVVKASAEFGNSEIVGGVLFHQSFTEESDAETVQMPLCLLPSKGEPDLTNYYNTLKKRFGDVVVHQRFDDMPHATAAQQEAALKYVKQAEAAAWKVPGVPSGGIPLIPIKKVGIIGAGTMGGGIAMNFANVNIPVILLEVKEEFLTRGLAVIKRNYEISASRGRITKDDVPKRMALLSGTLEYADLADCDLIIEAVYENIEVKKEVFRKLDAVCKQGAILGTNTSGLNIDEIANATKRPSWVIGLHFFSPANVMRLIEIVVAEKTSLPVTATSMAIAKTIGKVAVLCKVCPGFVGNRILWTRQREAFKLIFEGALPWDVDAAIFNFGYPMGPFAMSDLVGLDVGWNKEASRGQTVRDRLCEMDRRGQKTGAGWYDYDPQTRKAKPSALVEKMVLDFNKEKGAPAPKKFTQQEILERCIYPMINEGAKLLEEKIAIRPSDIDVIYVNGYGWPQVRGGPMYYADQIGLDKVLNRLREWTTPATPEFKPSALLERMVKEGKKFADLGDVEGWEKPTVVRKDISFSL
ncbi:hypothetical protein HDU93_004517 [Gonapodya sp. JEL0774]|nr:hypothetical protein HDU93_004517 [Gonapodya sp. JEL0774]